MLVSIQQELSVRYSICRNNERLGETGYIDNCRQHGKLELSLGTTQTPDLGVYYAKLLFLRLSP